MLTQLHAVLHVHFYWEGRPIGAALFREHYLVLGRDSTLCDIVLNHPTVSREHLLIEHDGRRITVQDMHSTNGMRIDGMRTVKAEFHPGDSLQLFGYTLTFYLRYGELALQQALDFQQAYLVPTPEQLSSQTLQSEIFQIEEPQSSPDNNALSSALSTVEPTWLGEAPLGNMEQLTPKKPIAAAKLQWIERLLRPSAGQHKPPRQCALIATLWQQQLLAITTLRSGQQYQHSIGAVQERLHWLGKKMALQVHLTRYGYATAKIPLHTNFVLRRNGMQFAPQQGIREGWVKRRKNYLISKISKSDQLLIEHPPFLYQISLGACSEPLSRRQLGSTYWQRALTFAQQQGNWALPLFVLQGLCWFFLLASQAPQQPTELRPPINQAVMPTTIIQLRLPGPKGRVADEQPEPSRSNEQQQQLQGGGPKWHIPGGNPAPTIAGLLVAPPLTDPAQPKHLRALPLRESAALWRNTQTKQLPSFIEHAIYRNYKLQLGSALRVHFDQSDYDLKQTCLRQLAEFGPALSQCFAKSPPPDAGLRTQLSLIATIAGSGKLVQLRERDRSIGDQLLQCIRKRLDGIAFAKHQQKFIQAELQLVFEFEGLR